MAVLLAIAAAASWGLSDFLAGLASRRVAVALVLLCVEAGGLLVVVPIALVAREPFFGDAGTALTAAAGGLSGVLALGCFYRALAIGTMSVVAPISAAGVTLPVIVGVASGDRPSAIMGAGLVAVVAGVLLASREEHVDAGAATVSRRAIGLALVSALGFGGFFALPDGPADTSVLWTIVLARAAPLPLVALAVARTRPAPPARALLAGLLGVGTIDLLATSLIGWANTKGDLSVVSVIGGMYPVMTVILAGTVLRERLRGPQVAGVVLALGGVATVAAA
jgi:drug/metabolite transporter (DMT)-like permease